MQKSKLKIVTDVVLLQGIAEVLVSEPEFLEEQQSRVDVFKGYAETFMPLIDPEKDSKYIIELLKKKYTQSVDDLIKKLAAEQAKDNASAQV